MKVWRVIPVSVLFLISVQVNAGYFVVDIKQSIDLISGGIHCSGWEGNDYKDFYIYAGFSTINISGDICHLAVPNTPGSCEAAYSALTDFFAATEICLYWQPSSTSADFICKGRRSQLITIYYDLCGLMHQLE